MASATEVHCSRCGAAGHLAVSCPKKSFMRPLCVQCNCLGHLKANCPQLRECHYCHGLGHVARDCPKKPVTRSPPPSEVKGKGEGEGKAKGQGKGNGKARAEKEDDQQSIQSNSTVPTVTDHVPATPVMQKCRFCGTVRAAAKHKRGHNACKDRCQQCFRPFKQ